MKQNILWNPKCFYRRACMDCLKGQLAIESTLKRKQTLSFWLNLRDNGAPFIFCSSNFNC